MQRDPRAALDDILDAARWIAEYVEGMDLQAFCDDPKIANHAPRHWRRSPEIPLVELDFVILEEGAVLLLERPRPMVLLLIADVADEIRAPASVDGKRTVPREWA